MPLVSASTTESALPPGAASQALSVTEDTLLGGAMSFQQPARGYRVNIDSVMLAHFASAGRHAARALDLGAGVGVLPLLLQQLSAASAFTLLEREPELCALAQANLARAGIVGDVTQRDLALEGLPLELLRTGDLVISNPPFFTPNEHRPPEDLQRGRARLGAIDPFLRAAASALRGPKGRAVFAYPARALTEFLAAATRAALVPKRLRFVHAFPGRAARLVLIELRAARPGGLVVEAPLVEWQAPGVPSPEVAAFTRARANGPA